MSGFAEDQMLTAASLLLNTAIPLQGSAEGAIVTGIFDANSIPTDQPFPYIELGATTGSPLDSFGHNGANMTLTIHTWSRYGGKKQLNAVRALVYDALDGKKLVMADYGATMTLDSANAQTDNTTSIKLWHGVDRYRAKAT